MSYPENIEIATIREQAASLWKDALKDNATPQGQYPVQGLEVFEQLITKEVEAIQGKSGVGPGSWARKHLGTARLERNPHDVGGNLKATISRLSLTVSDWTCRDWGIEVLQMEKPDGRELSQVNVTFQQRTISFIPAKSD